MLPTTDGFHDPATEVVGTSIPHDESLRQWALRALHNGPFFFCDFIALVVQMSLQMS